MPSQDALDIDNTGLLSEAALAALQLRQQPFRASDSGTLNAADDSSDGGGADGGMNTVDLFSDATSAEQLADIKQALITGDDLLLILGDEGAGKSTLLSQLDTNSGLRIQCFPVQGSERFSTLNLFSGMLEAFKQSPPDNLKDTLDKLIPCLQQMTSKNTLSAIILDDAHKVNQTELTQLLSGMLYINSQDETLLRVALAATLDFEDKIPDLLPEGADLPYSSLTIDGFTPQRAAAYLGFKLQNAGFDSEFPFSDRDMASLVEHSGGMPAELHALTADVLNEKHGRIEDSLPRELVADANGGFIQSRTGKLILGVIATGLIIGGLLMFMPKSGIDPSDPDYSVADNSQNISTEELKLIKNNAQNTTQNTTQNGQNTAPAVATQSGNLSTDVNIPAPPAPQTSGTGVLIRQQSSSASSENTAGTSASAIGTPATGTVIAEQPGSQNAAQSPAQTAVAETTASTEADTRNTNSGAQINTDTNTTASDGTAGSAGGNQVTVQAAATEPVEAPVSPEDAELAERLESPNWILLQDASRYTIQMSASRERASVENFLRQNPLPAPNSIFSFERDGIVWYALAHGIFNSIEEARLSVERMPAPALRDQPWIRSIRRIQSILRTP